MPDEQRIRNNIVSLLKEWRARGPLNSDDFVKWKELYIKKG